jgi:lysyl-tRNA synthetase class 2
MTEDGKQNNEQRTHSGGHASIEQAREGKLQAIKEMGIDPYGERYDGAEPAAEIKARFRETEQKLTAEHAEIAEKTIEENVLRARCAGRIVLLRDIGKLIFITLRDSSGTIQVGLSKSLLAAKWSFMKLLGLGQDEDGGDNDMGGRCCSIEQVADAAAGEVARSGGH